MARSGFATIRVTHNRLSAIAKALPAEVSVILRRGTFATQAGGMARAPVDTEFLRSSHGTEGTTPGSLSMRVTVTAEYGAAVHTGTRTMPGRPWLRQTTVQTFPATIRELQELEKRLSSTPG